MLNQFNQKLAAAKKKRARLYIKLKDVGMSEVEIARKFKISRQKVNEVINYGRRNVLKG